MVPLGLSLSPFPLLLRWGWGWLPNVSPTVLCPGAAHVAGNPKGKLGIPGMGLKQNQGLFLKGSSKSLEGKMGKGSKVTIE